MENTPHDEPWRHGDAHVNGVRLHYVEAGDGPLVVLLHGFPEFWYAWRHQIPALADAGFRVVAPDMRGYNLSDKPRGVSAYRMETLVDDVAGLVHALGAERAHVVGHDWGGMVAWYTAMLRPEVVNRLTVLNAPHPRRFRQALRTRRQWLRSWYAAFFQLPLLPEMMLRANGFGALMRTLRSDPVRPDAFSRDDRRRYREALSRPGALTAMLHYYRAAVRHPPRRTRSIDAPTLLIWGDGDRHLLPELADGLERWVPRLRVERLAASHWVMADAPERVNALLVDFLREGTAA
jgi:epoxide hydrolase 4